MSAKYDDLIKFQKNLEKISSAEKDEFISECAKELAARLLAKVIKRTPTRKPEDCPAGVTGGNLRRGWTGGKKSSAKAFVDSLNISHVGNTYVIEITNNVDYASYVEYGHRTRNHKGWVEGRKMLTKSEAEIKAQAPKILEAKLNKWLSGVMK